MAHHRFRGRVAFVVGALSLLRVAGDRSETSILNASISNTEPMTTIRQIIIALLLACTLTGCPGVTPVVPEHSVPAWSGNDQNGGILSIDKNGAVITPAAQREFNDLALKYGRMVVPNILPNLGSVWRESDGNYQVTMEMLSRWHELLMIRDRVRVDGK